MLSELTLDSIKELKIDNKLGDEGVKNISKSLCYNVYLSLLSLESK